VVGILGRLLFGQAEWVSDAVRSQTAAVVCRVVSDEPIGETFAKPPSDGTLLGGDVSEEAKVRGYVDTDWGQVHFQHAGEAGPALVLFHESPLSSRIFERALPILGNSLRVWAFDTPGYGESDPPDHPLEIPEYATRLLQAADRLRLGRFAVGGTHTGASIAVEVALQAGLSHVTHAILTGLPLFTDAERKEFLATWAPRVNPDADGRHLQWAWERYVRIWGEDSPPELLNLGATELLRNLPRYQWAYQAAFRYDPAPALPSLTLPVLLLNAEHDLNAHTDAVAVHQLPNARYVSVPGLRGQLPWRMPNVYAAEIAAFVAGSSADNERPTPAL
jgi:pimeloyl-ACP methyl ester carboxylesterase